MKRLFVTEAEQQSIVNWTMLLADIGLATVLVVLALFMIWRLYDLFQAKGRWAEEFNHEKQQVTKQEIEEQKRKLKELEQSLQEDAK
jgi:biopolymer transport protein ExbB/TolQ